MLRSRTHGGICGRVSSVFGARNQQLFIDAERHGPLSLGGRVDECHSLPHAQVWYVFSLHPLFHPLLHTPVPPRPHRATHAAALCRHAHSSPCRCRFFHKSDVRPALTSAARCAPRRSPRLFAAGIRTCACLRRAPRGRHPLDESTQPSAFFFPFSLNTAVSCSQATLSPAHERSTRQPLSDLTLPNPFLAAAGDPGKAPPA